MISFTVIMSVYKNDTADLVSKALNSCEANENKPVEYLIYIDGPIARNIEHVLEEFCKYHQVRVFHSDHNMGLSNALNRLLSEVRTAWFARMDADDVNVPGRFDIQSKFLSENPEVDILGGQILEVAHASNAHKKVKRVPTEHSQIINFAKFRNPMNHMTVMGRTELVTKTGSYPEIPFAEDYGLWAKLLDRGAVFHNVPDVLVHATVDHQFYSRRGGLSYILAQFVLQRHLYLHGVTNIMIGALNCITRGVIFALPPSIRSVLYRRYLRR